MIIAFALVTTNNRSIALLFTVYYYYLILSSARCLLLLSSIIYKRKNFELSKSRFSLQLSSWEFKSSRRACANERKRWDYDNTLHKYIKRLQSNSQNTTKQRDNYQNSDLQESENRYKCYCWSSRDSTWVAKNAQSTSQESKIKEYAIVRI